MPNNIPDVTVAVTSIPYSIKYIDQTGDRIADSYPDFDNANVTPVNVQAFNVAMGVATQASMFTGSIIDVFNSLPDKNDAIVGDRSENSNVLNILAKHTDGRSASAVIRAPVPAIFIANSDDIDPASSELAGVFTAFLALLPTGFGIISVRYSGRKQYNKAQPI